MAGQLEAFPFHKDPGSQQPTLLSPEAPCPPGPPHWPHASHECPTLSPQEGQAQAQAARPSAIWAPPCGPASRAPWPGFRLPCRRLTVPGSPPGGWLSRQPSARLDWEGGGSGCPSRAHSLPAHWAWPGPRLTDAAAGSSLQWVLLGAEKTLQGEPCPLNFSQMPFTHCQVAVT